MSGLIKGAGKLLKGVVKTAAPFAGPIGTVLGGPVGGMIGGAIGDAVGGGGSKQGPPIFGGSTPAVYGRGNPYAANPYLTGGAGSFGPMPAYAGGGGWNTFGPIGGIIGHNLSQADARKEYARLLGMNTADWTTRGDRSMDWRQLGLDQNIDYRGKAIDQDYGDWDRRGTRKLDWRQQAADQDFGNKQRMDTQGWSNWDQGMTRLPAIHKMLAGKG